MLSDVACLAGYVVYHSKRQGPDGKSHVSPFVRSLQHTSVNCDMFSSLPAEHIAITIRGQLTSKLFPYNFFHQSPSIVSVQSGDLVFKRTYSSASSLYRDSFVRGGFNAHNKPWGDFC